MAENYDSSWFPLASPDTGIVEGDRVRCVVSWSEYHGVDGYCGAARAEKGEVHTVTGCYRFWGDREPVYLILEEFPGVWDFAARFKKVVDTV